jgi:nitrite reductase (NO-forming)/hydroxylamine reductase
MPNWGTSGDLTEAEVDMMARYVQQEPPTPPEWGMKEMMASLKISVPPEQRPDEEDERPRSGQPLFGDAA